MKKLLVLLFSVLLSSSICFAEQVSVAASGDQAKTTENKNQDVVKKSVKPKVKKSGKKAQKKNRSKKDDKKEVAGK